jgi:hypothetical protein
VGSGSRSLRWPTRAPRPNYSDEIALARGVFEGGKIMLMPGQSPAEEFATPRA